MEILRTPSSRFAACKDFPFEPHYVEVGGSVGRLLRMHYVDEGPREAAPILMLHGEPTWSYLYRHMIPPCVAAGHRVIAPDLIGFGRSDKPSSIGDYSYARHVAWVRDLIELLDLREITLVCQDWGSLIGLRLAAEHEQRFARIVLANGMLPTGEQRTPAALEAWLAFARYSPYFPISTIVRAGTKRALDEDELRAYDAPFPSRAYKAGARALPTLVPTHPDDPASPANRAAWQVLERWDKPFLTVFSDGDPITRGGDRYVQKRVPGAAGLAHEIVSGGHFIQEDAPEQLVAATLKLISGSSG
jgi:haloalkane dehalogenase